MADVDKNRDFVEYRKVHQLARACGCQLVASRSKFLVLADDQEEAILGIFNDLRAVAAWLEGTAYKCLS